MRFADKGIPRPPLDFYSRKPVVVLPRRRRRKSRTNNAEKGRAEDADDDEDNLDRHVEDVLRKRDRFRRVMQGVWSFVKTRMWFSVLLMRLVLIYIVSAGCKHSRSFNCRRI